MDSSGFYRQARTDLDGPMHGIRVLDVTTAWSGPMAACILADLGCEVIRVEMPRNMAGQLPPRIPGTSLSWFHQTVNRNKRCIGLDLRVPAARPVFLRLVATADVVIENFLPGTLAGWGIGYDQCREVKPDLVMVSITGFGQFGPDSRRRGYDPIVLAGSGWMSLNGPAEGEPVKAPTFLSDDISALHAAVGALAALRHRDVTGEGQHVDIAMLDALLYSSDGFLTLGAAGAPLRRTGDEADFFVPSNRFSCTDGSIYLVAALDRHWRSLAAAIGRPELATAPGFRTHRERLGNRAGVNEAIAAWCAPRQVAEVITTLESAGVAAGPVRTFAEAAADPHVAERGMLVPAELSDGSTAPLVGPAAKFSRTPTSVRRAAPPVGADTADVLTELGLGTAELGSLHSEGAIDLGGTTCQQPASTLPAGSQS